MVSWDSGYKKQDRRECSYLFLFVSHLYSLFQLEAMSWDWEQQSKTIKYILEKNRKSKAGGKQLLNIWVIIS